MESGGGSGLGKKTATATVTQPLSSTIGLRRKEDKEDHPLRRELEVAGQNPSRRSSLVG